MVSCALNGNFIHCMGNFVLKSAQKINMVNSKIPIESIDLLWIFFRGEIGTPCFEEKIC